MSRKPKKRSRLLEAIMLLMIGATLMYWAIGIKNNSEKNSGATDAPAQSIEASQEVSNP